MSLHPFWCAAARLAGRLDLQPLLPALRRGPIPPSAAAMAAAGIAPAHVAALVRGDVLPDAIDTLTPLHAAWPRELADVPFAPPVLFLRGRPELLARPAIAIVGSRQCTGQGARMARRLAQDVVARGAVVVSGLAHGIDHAAHLASCPHTIAVLGQGLDAPLTARQQELADRIVDQGGLLLSELPPDTPAARWTFPQRNRIIAGLARATIVVEAAERSGALITARQALALGREVLAVPGSPLDPASAGCLDLIAAGAGLAREGRDLDRLLPRQQALLDAPVPVHPDLPPQAGPLLQRGVDVDQLAQAIGWPGHRVATLLMALELTGRVQRLPGDRFVLPRPE